MSIKDQNGFTLIELMLAMTIFTLVMLIATTGFIGINRTYTRGLVRKQLSESVQAVTNDVTSIIRTNNQTGSAVSCTSGAAGCTPTSGWSELCFSGSRYLWQASGGIYKDTNSCAAAVDSSKEQLVDLRYRVQSLTVTPSSDYLFNVHGVLSTTDQAAFNQQPTTTNADTLQCLGTAQSSAVRICAVQAFDFLVNSRGAGVQSI